MSFYQTKINDYFITFLRITNGIFNNGFKLVMQN